MRDEQVGPRVKSRERKRREHHVRPDQRQRRQYMPADWKLLKGLGIKPATAIGHRLHQKSFILNGNGSGEEAVSTKAKRTALFKELEGQWLDHRVRHRLEKYEGEVRYFIPATLQSIEGMRKIGRPINHLMAVVYLFHPHLRRRWYIAPLHLLQKMPEVIRRY